MCISTPDVPKYDPPVTVEAPEPQKAAEPLKEKTSETNEKNKRRTNKKGLRQLRSDLAIPGVKAGATGGLTIPRG